VTGLIVERFLDPAVRMKIAGCSPVAPNNLPARQIQRTAYPRLITSTKQASGAGHELSGFH
jgi:hypothetical protein